MHNSSVIHSGTDEWDATLSYVAVAETTQRFHYFCSTQLKVTVHLQTDHFVEILIFRLMLIGLSMNFHLTKILKKY